jgi:hypothetical protein
MAQKPTELQSLSTTLPRGFFPFDAFPTSMLRATSSRSKVSFTAALSFAEQDFPEQTKTWWRIGAEVTGASAQSSSRSLILVLSSIRRKGSVLESGERRTRRACSAERFEAGILFQAPFRLNFCRPSES